MENIIIKLKPGVTQMEQNGILGLFFAESVRLAKDARQAAFIQALTAHEQPLEALQKILKTRGEPPPDEAAAALELAAFILDFEDYIES